MIKSGIYKIINIHTNQIYIGSSKNLIERKKRHFHNLRSNKHCNPKLQYSFNKYTERLFAFQIIELCKEEVLLVREQYYLDVLLPYF